MALQYKLEGMLLKGVNEFSDKEVATKQVFVSLQ